MNPEVKNAEYSKNQLLSTTLMGKNGRFVSVATVKRHTPDHLHLNSHCLSVENGDIFSSFCPVFVQQPDNVMVKCITLSLCYSLAIHQR